MTKQHLMLHEILPYSQRMEGAKKNRMFGVFSKLFLTYMCRKNAANRTLRKILRRFLATFLRHLLRHPLRWPCGTFYVIILRCRKNAAESNEVSYLRRFCGAYKWAKLKKSQKSVYYVVGLSNTFYTFLTTQALDPAPPAAATEGGGAREGRRPRRRRRGRPRPPPFPAHSTALPLRTTGASRALAQTW